MTQKNKAAAERKTRRMEAGTFIGCRPRIERVRTKYDRKAVKRADQRTLRSLAW